MLNMFAGLGSDNASSCCEGVLASRDGVRRVQRNEGKSNSSWVLTMLMFAELGSNKCLCLQVWVLTVFIFGRLRSDNACVYRI